MLNKPYFTVFMDVCGCLYDVRVNDFPVFIEKNGNPIMASVPINHYLRDGENEISCILSPLPETKVLDEAAICVLRVQWRPFDEPEAAQMPVCLTRFAPGVAPLELRGSSAPGKYNSQNNFIEDANGDVVIGNINLERRPDSGLATVNRKFTLPLPFPTWKWFDGDILNNDEETRQSLFNEYRNIWNAIHELRIELLLPLFKERFSEMAAAYFDEEEKFTSGFQLGEDANNPEEELFGLYPDTMPLLVFGYGRLAKLTTWDGGAAIGFNYKDVSASSNYDIIFRRENGKWIICR